MGKPALEINHHQMTIDCYNQDAPYWGTRFLSLDTGELCQRFLSHLPEKTHILDIGCGPGRDTKYFLDHGYQVTAFDAAEELVKLARQHTGQPILHMTFEEMTFREEFEGIWSMASLLHISHQDIVTVFKNNLIPALKPQGVLYLCLQYGEGERISKDRYFADYTEKSLQSLFEQFEELTTLDIWINEDNTPDRKGRNWVNGLVKKKENGILRS